MNVGTVIRSFRQKRGLSQGDLEKRTGLMRCYISRVENGHTVPSIETLSRIARALDAQLSELFVSVDSIGGSDPSEQQFLEEMRRYLPVLSNVEREQVLEMVRRLASQVES
jgi:transcriptional regulator with XRE-family HTH domain